MVEHRKEYRGIDKDIWPQVQFHDERVYKNLEIFIQITLAISGGLAYLAVHKVSENKNLIVSMIKLAAGLEILVGVYTSLAVVMHLFSQVRRYEDRENLLGKSVSWLEPYMILFILSVSLLVAYVAYYWMAVTIVQTP